MSSAQSPSVRPIPFLGSQNFLNWVSVLALIYLLIVAVSVIGSGFKAAVGEQATELFAFATNPFLGLIVGTVATALIQSSSTTTSIVVGLVAGGLPVITAIPIIMGANIGTSITNTLVSAGHIGNKAEFRRAFAAATVLDMFNLLAVLIFLPLEILFHPLERLSLATAGLFLSDESLSMKGFNFIGAATAPAAQLITGSTGFLPTPFDGILQIILGILLIFFSIYFVGKLLKRLLVGKAKEILHMAIGRGPIAGILSGTLMTILVQSSSTTTSLMVPLAGSGVFGMAEIYPFTLGANVGTCVTAFLAATAVTGPAALPALEIALVHFYFNFLGLLIIFGIPFLCRLPVLGAESLAAAASEHKAVALIYVAGVFFVLPGICLGLSLVF
ncbi:Na/Pi cotransporter family protein [Synechococcales cyanobacterium C]|uniref:Na/Pi cotransporter family protein n=1 Tax=Petrachloros mirabilis ULC683 TaxID=2781853 RepID=A0A8K2A6G8_9CYAN|nr:Na/Pi symporter [Petrachloros mirabilis]NCJ05165.1 Na/Pi cotransporter family protein [Petrachloros mirabilis ULC683]